MQRRLIIVTSVAAVVLGTGPSVGCRPQAADAKLVTPKDLPVTVATLQAQPTSVPRVTTQPATVHAWFESAVLAKTAGYVADLKVDIGQTVTAGQMLAVVAVPEVERQRDAKEAEVARWVAEERRAEAQIKVAEAGVVSKRALCEKAKADVAKAMADATAAQAEADRISQLVRDKAVADRLLDEAKRNLEATQAAQQSAVAAVTSDEAELALAEARVEAARAELEVTQANTQVARSDVEQLKARLAYAEIRSPLTGIVTRRHVAPGDLVRNAESSSGRDNLPLFVVAQVDKVRLRASVPERDAPWVDVGDAVSAKFASLDGREFPGTVTRTAGSLDEQTRTLLIEVDLDNADGQLMPGMFGQVTITLEKASERLTLPAGAVRFDEQGAAHVYVVNRDNRIEVLPVKTGRDDGARIEIREGLQGTEHVVGPLGRRLPAGQVVRTR